MTAKRKKAAVKKPEVKKTAGDKPVAAKSSVPAKKVDGEANWGKEITRLKAWRDKMSSDILRYRHSTGVLALAVAAERGKDADFRKYGNHTVHDVCIEIEEAESTVYACMKFAGQTTVEQLAHLIKQGWAWRAASALVTVEDPKVRKQLQNEYEKGKFSNSDAFKEAVRDRNEAAKASGEKQEKRGGGAGTTAQKVKGFMTVSTAFVSRTVPEFVAGIESFVKEAQSMSPRTAEVVTEYIKTAKETVPELRKQLDRAEAAIKKTGI